MSGAEFDLAGRTALVTGASRGIGRALALALAEAGANVALTARRKEALSEVCDAVAAMGGDALPFELDVTDLAAIAGTVERAAAHFGTIDILVNNAGIEEVRPSLDVDESLWDRILDTNLKGAFFTAQAVAKTMRAGLGGSIVNLCSLTSSVGVPTAVPYGSSKSGLLGMTRALAAEWAELGIRVNAIAPGYFQTAMTDGFYADPAWQTSMLAKIPMRRFGGMNDLGGAVVFLASDASAYITGQCLAIDGGFLASI